MVNEIDLINIIIGHIYILPMFSEKNWVIFRYVHCIYIFKRKNIADFFENVCIYPGLKYEKLNFALHIFFLPLLFT